MLTDANDFQYIHSLLGAAFKKCKKLPRHDKKRMISIYLQYLLKDFCFEKKEKFITFTKNNSNEVKYLSKSTVSNTNKDIRSPAIDAISRVDMLFNLNDIAMQKAALSVFNRLLDAMDPAVIKKMIRKKMFSSTMKYDAAAYNVYVEKYQRLKIYSENGKLASDFHDRFKKCLKEELLKADEM